MIAWQTAFEDVGPAGVDKGKGGKYLILPPDYKDKAPDGYIALPFDTYAGLCAGCARFSEAAARPTSPRPSRTASGSSSIRCRRRRIRPPTTFVDAMDRCIRRHDSLRPALLPVARPHRADEPWLTSDKAMIDQLKSIGIEKGKPFNPDAKTQGTLPTQPREAQAWLNAQYERVFSHLLL